MSFDDEVRGISESHAPAAGSDEVRVELARESVKKLGEKIQQLTANVAQLEADFAASTISLGDYEKTRRDLDKAISIAKRNLAMYEMHEKRISKLFSNT